MWYLRWRAFWSLGLPAHTGPYPAPSSRFRSCATLLYLSWWSVVWPAEARLLNSSAVSSCFRFQKESAAPANEWTTRPRARQGCTRPSTHQRGGPSATTARRRSRRVHFALAPNCTYWFTCVPAGPFAQRPFQTTNRKSQRWHRDYVRWFHVCPPIVFLSLTCPSIPVQVLPKCRPKLPVRRCCSRVRRAAKRCADIRAGHGQKHRGEVFKQRY